MSAAEPPPDTGQTVYTLEDLRRWPEATAGLAHPLRLAVFGDPVAHSASPPMHNAALAALGLPMRYARIHVRPDELAEALGLIAAQGFVGVNLTLPHKAAALSLLDEIDLHAVRLGAVNTVQVKPGGRLCGFNTDGPGFVQAVREEFGVGITGKAVMILGAAGGAGRALAAQCILEGCGRLVLVNRIFEKARMLAQDLHTRFPEMTAPREGGTSLEVVEWERAPTRSLLAALHLAVNTTSIGLRNEDASPFPVAVLPAGLFVFDTVYRSSGTPTPLVTAARGAGAQAAGGLALLLHQGALAFEHWFGQPPPVEIMRRAL